MIVLTSLSGCAPPPVEEIPDVDFALHNEQAIDRYLKQLLDSEDRKITGFTEAARWGRIQIVEELLGSGMDVDAQDEYGRTALVLAASGGQLEIVELLIEHGANVNFQGKGNGFTPLIALLGALHSERVYSLGVQIFLDAGAQTTFKDQNGRNAIDWVQIRIKEGRLPPEFLNELKARRQHPKEEAQRQSVRETLI